MSIRFYSQYYFDKNDIVFRLKTNEVGPQISGTCPLKKEMHASHNVYTRNMQLVQCNKFVHKTYTLKVIRGNQISWDTVYIFAHYVHSTHRYWHLRISRNRIKIHSLYIATIYEAVRKIAWKRCSNTRRRINT
jgi:hypothetical protein